MDARLNYNKKFPLQVADLVQLNSQIDRVDSFLVIKTSTQLLLIPFSNLIIFQNSLIIILIKWQREHRTITFMKIEAKYYRENYWKEFL